MAIESSDILPLGAAMPTLALPDPDGTVHDVSADATGAPVLVVFACNHCPYVVHVGPRLGQLADRWMADGLAVAAVASNDVETHPEDGPEHMGAFAGANGWTFPYLVDADQATALAFGARCTPDIFLFDRAHRLAYHGQFDASRPGSGDASGDDLAAAVTAVLAGRDAPAEQRPAVGCSIKWTPGNDPT